MDATREQLLGQFSQLHARISTIGIPAHIHPSADDFELQQQVFALDEFLYEYDGIWDTLQMLQEDGDISRQPTDDEIVGIIPKMFSKIIEGDWDGTPNAVKKLLVRRSPDLSPKRAKRS